MKLTYNLHCQFKKTMGNCSTHNSQYVHLIPINKKSIMSSSMKNMKTEKTYILELNLHNK